MSDLNSLQATEATRIVGSDATGNEQTPVQSTASGSLYVNNRDNSGNEIGISANPFKIDPTGTTTQPISAAALPLPTGAATETTQIANGVLIGAVTETAPATDAASSGLNGRLQRIAQRITSMIALLPGSLGQKTMANSFAVTLASDQSSLLVLDYINVTGQYRAQSVTTSAAEALGSASILTNRKMLSITPTNGIVYWGYSNAVTISSGVPIFKNQTVTFAVGPSIHIYLIAGSTIDCRITEGS